MNTRFELTDNYRTVPAEVPFVSRLLPELSFYSRFLWTVFKAAAKTSHHRYDRTALCRSSLDVLRDLESIGVCFEIDGTGYLQSLETPCVIVANHMSVLETAILPVVIQPIKDLTFIVKESLMRYPVFKHVLATLDPIVVSRINPRQDLRTVMQEGIDRLNRGMSVVVFPQTTRSNAFDARRFNSLGIKLAQRANVPAVPLALTTDAWGNGRIIKDFGKIDTSKTVRFSFGQPITIQGRAGQAHQVVIEFIKGKLSQWRYITSTAPSG
ncbi:MAG: lysophospholipid acyltransferase family protein [Desulfobacteraceae bacterium]|jgi:1-acyl-sn-glycerol-3-phosphate acyltransferase